MTTKRSLPIIGPGYRKYDTDGKRGLSPSEIANMPVKKAAELFQKVVSKSTYNLSYDSAIAVFNRLPVNVQQGTLLCMTNDTIRDRYMKKMAQTNLKGVIDVIGSFSEGSLANFESAFLAYSLIRPLPKAHKEKLMATLTWKNIFSPLPRNIRRHARMSANISALEKEFDRGVRYKTALDGFRHVLKRLNAHPKVFAFGVSHEDTVKPGIPTTLERISKEFMPCLIKNGVTRFVIEGLPHDISQAELQYYFKKGKVDLQKTPILWFFKSLLKRFNFPTSRNIFTILDRAKEFKKRGVDIEIYGCYEAFPTLKSIIMDDIDPDVLNSQIHVHAAKHINTFLKEGRRVAVITGAFHNDIVPENGHKISFVKLLQNSGLDLRYYKEIDMLLPDYLEASPTSHANLRYDSYLKSMVPEKGAVVFTKNEGRTIVTIYPRNKAALFRSKCLECQGKSVNKISMGKETKELFKKALNILEKK